MSLSKQLLFLISSIFLVIFSINFLISVNHIRSYLQVESEVHAQDTATSLGLSISPYLAEGDGAMIETMLNVIFDRGYYQEIRLTDRDGSEMFQLTNERIFEEVPHWFVEMLPMKVAVGISEISSGWTLGGVLYVTANPGYGYLKLYQQAKGAFYYSLAAFAISLLLLVLILRFTLLPLKRIDRLACTIAEGRFETIEELPWTSEIRHVAVSMNRMSSKIENIIGSLQGKLEAINRRLKTDDLTGLDIKSTFETDIKQLFMSGDAAFILIVRADCLGDYVKENGPDAGDAFLREFADGLRAALSEVDGGFQKAYRFHGGEFAMIVRRVGRQEVGRLAQRLRERFDVMAQRHGLRDIAHIGAAPFDPMGTGKSNIAAAEEAYEQATLIGANGCFIREAREPAKDPTEWKALLRDIIDNGKFRVSYVGQVFGTGSEQSRQVLMEEAFTGVFDDAGEPIPIGAFVALAEKFGKIVDLDRGVTERVIEHILQQELKHDIVINLSMDSLHDAGFREWLAETLIKNRGIAGQLVFSVSAYAATRDFDRFREFTDFIHHKGGRVMLKRFETQFIPLEQVKTFQLDFIRMARAYTQGIADDAGKRAFVGAMKELGDLLDIHIIAENVSAEADLEAVEAFGLYGASR